MISSEGLLGLKNLTIVIFFVFTFFISHTHGFIEGLYCGTENCYDIIEVTRDATKSEISKAYRKLARKWHPDMHRSKEDKASAEIMFQKLANAYEILKDEETRNDYDYMLDHPEEYYQHYYSYYRRRVAPKVDVRYVVVLVITLISAAQYWGAYNNYKSAISYLVTLPKYRLQAMEIAKEQGLLNQKKKKDRTKTKEEIREEEENMLRKVIEEKMDIRGGYRKPTVKDTLWLQIILFPYHASLYLWWYGSWIWTYDILRNEYGEEEKFYLIRKKLKLSQGQFESLEDHQIEDLMEKKLWVHSNFVEWKKDQDEEMKQKMAENTQYKKYRRYMRKGGPGQMTFGPD